MTKTTSWLMVIAAVVLAVVGGKAISAQDKYTVQVPNGLSFSEFKGYEDWQAVAVSQTGEAIAVILANPVMIEAYRAGVPGNGGPFPDGSKIAKIHWKPKKSADAPAPTTVPDVLHDVDFIERDSRKFPDTGGWGYAQFNYDAASNTFTPEGSGTNCGYACHTIVRQQITFSRLTRTGEREAGNVTDRLVVVTGGIGLAIRIQL